MTLVTLHQLSHEYEPGTAAVADLTLTIPSGRITALLGPSGCGKTTTLKMIAGLLPPTSGDVQFDGRSVLPIPAEQRGAVLSFQNHLLFPHLTVAENIAFGLKMRRVPRPIRQARVAEMLDMVQLAGYQGRRPSQLSGGQQQRVALARALIIQPQLLLLDEPLSNLDAHLRDEMRDLIVRLQRQMGITTLFVTHDQQEAVILGDQIALLFEGRLAQVGPPSAFYERPHTAAIARFFGGVNFLDGVWEGEKFRIANLDNVLEVAHPPQSHTTQLTIRPEHIQLATAETGPNILPARVLNTLYVGTHTRIRTAAAGHTLELLLWGQPHLEIGTAVSLYLPPSRLWPLVDEKVKGEK